MALGCELEEHPIGQQSPDGQELTIDVAWFGASEPVRTVVVSSGTHGVEGFMGSAVQAALLEDHLGGFKPPAGGRLVFIHAVNPYGFSWVRRVNEDNADLNRNFLAPGDPFEGAPDGYAELDELLNPPSAPARFEPFLLKVAVKLLRQGMPALKNAVAGGQYDYPKGLFFGGHAPSASYQVLDRNIERWVGPAERVLHIDFHTGLGKRADYKLFVDCAVDSPAASELRDWFGDDRVESWDTSGTSYTIRGGLGSWCKAKLGDHYDVLACEYGTTNVINVIRALRAENRAHQWGRPDDASTVRAKKDLMEVFEPSDRAWRDAVVSSGVRVVQQAIDGILS
jgi:hypothetical protein